MYRRRNLGGVGGRAFSICYLMTLWNFIHAVQIAVYYIQPKNEIASYTYDMAMEAFMIMCTCQCSLFTSCYKSYTQI